MNALAAPVAIAAVVPRCSARLDEDSGRRVLRLEPRRLLAVIGDRRARLGGSDSTIADRIPLLAALIVLVFGVFLLRLFQLQFIQTDDLRRRSRAQLRAHACASRRRAATSSTARAACSRRRAPPSACR